MPTYHSSKAGEIPYNELSEFFYANFGLANLRTKVEKKDGIFSVQTEDGKMILFSVDPNKDIVTSFSDANSSHYKLSSPYVLAGKKGDGYHHYDEGFPCDKEFPAESWYDVAKIDQFLASL